MRKLATLTAAAALAAVMLVLPATSAFAGEKDVVILKCAEIVETDRNLRTDSRTRAPSIVAYQGTGTLETPPDECDVQDTCAPCLKTLINDGQCSADRHFPGSPILVQDLTIQLGCSAIPNPDGGGLDPFCVLSNSIEKYVFSCGSGKD